eukprot:2083427-Prymnesium_polylepis.1
MAIGESGKNIKDLGVFGITATFSVRARPRRMVGRAPSVALVSACAPQVLAYLWLIVILNVLTPNIVTLWEVPQTHADIPPRLPHGKARARVRARAFPRGALRCVRVCGTRGAGH